MSSQEDQRHAGISETRRGQQMGDDRTNNPTKLEESEVQTPALRGERAKESKFYSDDSSQEVGSNAARQRSNTPSVPAAIPTNEPLGQSGGEREFKERQAEARDSE